MLNDRLAEHLYAEICHIPIIDPHSHIDPHKPAARNLEEILGYHYYTELAHSVGMDKAAVAAEVGPRDRVRAILYHMSQFDNTVQYTWFLEIARAFFNFQGDRITLGDANWLWDAAARVMARPDYEDWVLHRSNIEKVFLTNDFDDPLENFNSQRDVPGCARMTWCSISTNQRCVPAWPRRPASKSATWPPSAPLSPSCSSISPAAAPRPAPSRCPPISGRNPRPSSSSPMPWRRAASVPTPNTPNGPPVYFGSWRRIAAPSNCRSIS